MSQKAIPSKKWLLGIFIFITGILSFCSIQKQRPFWDMLPYMACIINLDESNPTVVHTKTYTEFNQYASPQMISSMLKDHPFCISMYESSAYFNQQLPFYKVKPLYIVLGYLFWKCGIPLFYALYSINFISIVAISIVLFKWTSMYLHPIYALLFSLILVFLPMHLYAYSIASPDTLSAALLIAGTYFLLIKQKHLLSILFFLLAVFARVDNSIFVFLLFTGFIMLELRSKTNSRNYYIIAIAALAGIVFLIQYISGGYSMQKMFYRSFIDLAINPIDIDTRITISQYANGIRSGLKSSMHNVEVYAISILLILNVFFYRRGIISPQTIWVFALIGSLFLRLFMHPLFENRYLFAYVIVLTLLLLNHEQVKKRLIQFKISG